MRTSIMVGSLLLASLAAASVARGESFFSFEFGTPDYSAHDTNATVDLFVRETVTGGTSSLLFQDGGLGGVGVSIILDNAGSARLSSLLINPSFDALVTSSGTAAMLSAIAFDGVGTFDADTGGTALVATLTFDLGDTATEFRATDIDPTLSDTVSFAYPPGFPLPFRVLDEMAEDVDGDNVVRSVADGMLTLRAGAVVVPLPSAAIAGGAMMATMAATTLWRRARRHSN